jgi:predicted GNAT superfamily acetyltransferase
VLAGTRPRVEGAAESVQIPEDINKVRARSVDDHSNWRLRIREEFQNKLDGGLIVRGFDRGNGSSRYLFGSDDPQFHFEAYR